MTKIGFFEREGIPMEAVAYVALSIQFLPMVVALKIVGMAIWEIQYAKIQYARAKAKFAKEKAKAARDKAKALGSQKLSQRNLLKAERQSAREEKKKARFWDKYQKDD